jgi:hypothetical protein
MSASGSGEGPGCTSMSSFAKPRPRSGYLRFGLPGHGLRHQATGGGCNGRLLGSNAPNALHPARKAR